jgi:hypothetical protein
VRQAKARLFRRGLLLHPEPDVWRNRLEGEDKSRKERSVLSGTEDRSLSYPKLEDLYPGLMEMDGEQNSNSKPEVTLSNLYPGLFDSEEEWVGIQDIEVSEMSQSSHTGLAVPGVPSSCTQNGDVRVKRRTGSLQAVTKVNLLSSENTRGCRPILDKGRPMLLRRGIWFPGQSQGRSTGVRGDGMQTQDERGNLGDLDTS